MNTIFATLLPIAFTFAANGDLTGVLENGLKFNQYTVWDSPRVQKFEIPEVGVYWYVCSDRVMESLKDLSICLAES